MPRLTIPVAAVIVSLFLSSCAIAPSEDDPASVAPSARNSTPTPVPTPAPETAVEPAVEPAEIVLHADSIEVLVEDGGVLESTSLFTGRDALVELLTFALEAEPTTSLYPDAHESRPGVIYDWGGLTLYLADGQWPDFTADVTRIEVTSATVNDVDIVTVSGIAVGSSVEMLDPATAYTTFDDRTWYSSDPITIPDGTFSDTSNFEYISSVRLRADATEVVQLVVPSTNWGV